MDLKDLSGHDCSEKTKRTSLICLIWSDIRCWTSESSWKVEDN
jgi:hypothetical protein